jgi:hypothetical protein
MSSRLDSVEPINLLKILLKSRYPSVRIAGVYGLSSHLEDPGVLGVLLTHHQIEADAKVSQAIRFLLNEASLGVLIDDEEPTRPDSPDALRSDK